MPQMSAARQSQTQALGMPTCPAAAVARTRGLALAQWVSIPPEELQPHSKAEGLWAGQGKRWRQLRLEH